MAEHFGGDALVVPMNDIDPAGVEKQIKDECDMVVLGIYNARFHEGQQRLLESLQQREMSLVVVMLGAPYDAPFVKKWRRLWRRMNTRRFQSKQCKERWRKSILGAASSEVGGKLRQPRRPRRTLEGENMGGQGRPLYPVRGPERHFDGIALRSQLKNSADSAFSVCAGKRAVALGFILSKQGVFMKYISQLDYPHVPYPTDTDHPAKSGKARKPLRHPAAVFAACVW